MRGMRGVLQTYPLYLYLYRCEKAIGHQRTSPLFEIDAVRFDFASRGGADSQFRHTTRLVPGGAAPQMRISFRSRAHHSGVAASGSDFSASKRAVSNCSLALRF